MGDDAAHEARNMVLQEAQKPEELQLQGKALLVMGGRILKRSATSFKANTGSE